jgi:hypothetical protein
MTTVRDLFIVIYIYARNVSHLKLYHIVSSLCGNLHCIYSIIDIASQGEWIVIDSPRAHSHKTGTLGKHTGNGACTHAPHMGKYIVCPYSSYGNPYQRGCQTNIRLKFALICGAII